MKKTLRILIFIVLLFLPNILQAADDSDNTVKITINSAEHTEYLKVPAAPISETQENDVEKDDLGQSDSKQDNSKIVIKKDSKLPQDELVIFTGLVSVSVSDKTSVSTITADKIIHNKTRETLIATGNVVYTRKIGSSAGETFKGNSLIFNIKKLEGVFVDGVIEQAPVKKNQDPFRIHTGLAGRNESGVIAFKDALLTTSKEEYPLWSIRASRIWLLPGNEMAFANGFLSIGVVPIMYFPFFYYPSDEMLFHPVFGFRNREGAFIQTTTYLLGAKPAPKADEATSFSNFMQSDTAKKQRLEGLFFKKLDEPAEDSGGSYLKLIADAYSGLGYLAGIDGKFNPKKGFIKQIEFQIFLGFSNTLYPATSTMYTPYGDRGKIYNKSNLFGKIVPFRYSFNFNMNITKPSFKLSILFPFVSDPFFKKDFMSRSEDMNWFKYFLNRDKLASLEGAVSEHFYYWKLDSSITPNFHVLQPWVSYLSIESISGRVNFEAKKNESLLGKDELYAPDRLFFYPKNIVPEVRISLGGTFFSTTMLTSQKKENFQQKNINGIINPFNEKLNPELEANAIDNIANKEDIADIDDQPKNFLQDFFPIFKIDPIKTYRPADLIDYNLTYKLSGTALDDITFNYKDWKKTLDINWNDFYSNYYKFTGYGKMESRFLFNKGLLDLSNSIEFNVNHQKHSLHKDFTEYKKLQLNNYRLNVYSIKNVNSLKIKPFLFTELFKPIYFEWSISEILFQNKFIGTVDNPAWKNLIVEWDKDYIKMHSISVGFGMHLKGYNQLIHSTINLLPLLQSYSFAGNFAFPYGKFNIFTRLYEKENHKKKWFWEPLKMDLIFSFPYNISLNQSYIYDIQNKRSSKYTVSFLWKYISATYAMSYDTPYKLLPAAGWQPLAGHEKFIPHYVDVNIFNSSNPIELYAWRNRVKLQFSFSSSLNFNLIRITDSYFSFAPKLTFKIHEFLDISFSALTRNNVIARYFQDSLNLPITIPGEKNVLKDLAYSFYFWDENTRKQSGFKLKSLNFDLTHYLKDWIMKLSYSVKPVLRTRGNRKYYEFAPTISFVVQWNPIGDIKVQAKKEDKVFSVDRGEVK